MTFFGCRKQIVTMLSNRHYFVSSDCRLYQGMEKLSIIYNYSDILPSTPIWSTIIIFDDISRVVVKLKANISIVIISLYYKKISPPPPPCQESRGRGGEGRGGARGGGGRRVPPRPDYSKSP